MQHYVFPEDEPNGVDEVDRYTETHIQGTVALRRWVGPDSGDCWPRGTIWRYSKDMEIPTPETLARAKKARGE